MARLGHRVTVVDPSPNALLSPLERRAAEADVADQVPRRPGRRPRLDVVERGGYDVVLCHGVLEYVEDPAEGVRNTVAALRPEGVLSLLAAGLGGAVLSAPSPVTSRRPGRRSTTRTADGAPAIPCRAASPPISSAVWWRTGLRVGAVHGVRVFADFVPGGLVDTEPGALDALLKLEAAAAGELAAFHSVATPTPCAR
ncbi:methyltransferase domain-containing protein [Streptomyces hirsutus]